MKSGHALGIVGKVGAAFVGKHEGNEARGITQRVGIIRAVAPANNALPPQRSGLHINAADAQGIVIIKTHGKGQSIRGAIEPINDTRQLFLADGDLLTGGEVVHFMMVGQRLRGPHD